MSDNNSIFEPAIDKKVEISYDSLPNSSFEDVNLGGAKFSNVNLKEAVFDDVNMDETHFNNVSMKESDFADMYMVNTKFPLEIIAPDIVDTQVQ